MSINELAKEIHENAKSKGFYDKEVPLAESLLLIHAEVSEACEASRKGKFSPELTENNIKISNIIFKEEFEKYFKNTLEDEIADVIIRCLDLSAYRGIDIESHIKAKMRYNSTREKMHGKLY